MCFKKFVDVFAYVHIFIQNQYVEQSNQFFHLTTTRQKFSSLLKIWDTSLKISELIINIHKRLTRDHL